MAHPQGSTLGKAALRGMNTLGGLSDDMRLTRVNPTIPEQGGFYEGVHGS